MDQTQKQIMQNYHFALFKNKYKNVSDMIKS